MTEEDGLYATCNVFYRRSAFEAAGGFDPDAGRRTTAVENHYKWVDAAKTLGCVMIRVNAASQGTPDEQQKLAADGTEVGRLGGEERHPVELGRLPAHVVQSVLAAEDANFAEHGGVDLTALARAAWNDIRGRKLQGGSTITQQLAKLNYTGSQRTVFRKFREVLYASRLEQKYSKRELLERYLNQVYFGDGNYGIAAAADHLFGATPEALTVPQAATLAGMIHAPGALDPYRHPDAVVQRRNHVLNEMAEHGRGTVARAESGGHGAPWRDFLEVPSRGEDHPIAAQEEGMVRFECVDRLLQ